MARRVRDDPEATVETQAVGRLERFDEEMSRVRGSKGFDVDRIVLGAGAALVVFGIVAIFLAWSATSRTPYMFEQIPYMISGGLLGVGLIFLGGFVYFAYWITRLVRETREQSNRAAELLDRIAESVDGASSLNGGGSKKPIAGGRGEFVATKDGTLFHRPDCQVVAGKPRLRRVEARTKGLQPCQICDPLGDE